MPYADKEKQKAAVREWQRKRKLEIAELKTNKPCVDCGIVYPHYVMQWDHLPEHIKFRNLGDMRWHKWQTFLDEIKKCELVCANCHAIRTYNRRAINSTAE